MKKNIIMFIVLIFCVAACSYGVAKSLVPEADKLVGVWVTAGDDEIEIYREGEKYFGKPVSHPDDEERLDIHNPDKSLRDRCLGDVEILEDFEYMGKDRWKKGKVYDPDNGQTYQCTISMKSDDEIKIRGFVGISLFGRTETWRRAAAE